MVRFGVLANKRPILTIFSVLMVCMLGCAEIDTSAMQGTKVVHTRVDNDGTDSIPVLQGTGTDSNGLLFSTDDTQYQVDSSKVINKVMEIQSRQQWETGNGYCGCCSIQQIALYYGTYISQDLCRKATQSQKEITIPYRAAEVLDNLRLHYEHWDSYSFEPQYMDFWVWMKERIHQDVPVMFGVYVEGGEYETYDHILVAKGFESPDITTFHEDDIIVYNDCSDGTDNNRVRLNEAWNSWLGTDEPSNPDCYTMCIPENVDYGTAVLGIQDDADVTKPVRISLASKTEPNFTDTDAVFEPEIVEMTVTVSDLQPNESYFLLRYNDSNKVPTQNFRLDDADDHWNLDLIPEKDGKKTLVHTVWSNEMAIYRCVPASRLAI